MHIKKYSFNKFRNYVVLTIIALLFFLPSFLQSNALWIQSEELTQQNGVSVDSNLKVLVDDNGVVHYINTEYIKDDPENTEVYYSNNSAPDIYTNNHFLSNFDSVDEPGNKIRLTNWGKDKINHTYAASTALAVGGPSNIPLVGFHSQSNLSGNTEAFLSTINPNTGNPKLMQLSSFSGHYENNNGDSDYSKIEYIDRIRDQFVVSRSSDNPFYGTFTSSNPSSGVTLKQNKFIDYPNDIGILKDRRYIAAGNTLLTFNGSGELIGYYGFSDTISVLNIQGNDSLFLESGGEVHWLNISQEIPKYIDSASLELEEDTKAYGIDSTADSVFIAAGKDGFISFKIEGNNIERTGSVRNNVPNFYISDVSVGNNTIYGVGDQYIYSSNIENGEGLNDLQSIDGIIEGQDGIAIESYYKENETDAIVMALANNTIFAYNFTNSETIFLHNQGTGIIDIELSEEGMGYSATDSGNIGIFNITGSSPSYINTWNGGSLDINSISLNSSSLFISNHTTGDQNIVHLNVSDSADPNIIGTNRTRLGGGQIFANEENSRIYINDLYYGLIILDGSTTDSLRVLGMKSLPETFSSQLYESNGYIYLLDNQNDNGMAIIDATDLEDLKKPTNNVSVVSFSGTTVYNDIRIVNNGTETWGFITNNNDTRDLIYFNLTASQLNPQNITYMTGFTGPADLEYEPISESLIVADGTGELKIIDVSNPSIIGGSAPSATSISLSAANRLDLNREQLYISNGTNGIRYYEIDTDGSINEGSDSYTTTSNTNDIVGYSSSIFAATESHGVGIFDGSDYNSLTISNTDQNIAIDYFKNGTAIALWENEQGLYYRYIYPNFQKSRMYQLSADSNHQNPHIMIDDEYKNSLIHIFYEDVGTSDFYHQRRENSTYQEEAIVSGTMNNIEVDIHGDTVGIIWDDGNDIKLKISTNFGLSWGSETAVTDDGAAIQEIDPAIYVKEGGFAEIIYQRSMQQNFTICMRSNFDGDFSNNEEFYGDYQPEEFFQSSPEISEHNGIVVGMYYNYEKGSGEWYEEGIKAFAYQSLYFESNGFANDIITAVGDFAYVSDGFSGIKVLDIADPTNPDTIGGIDLNGMAEGLFLDTNTLYVATGEKGLITVDVSTPSNPVLMDSLDTDGYSHNVYVSNEFAYVADGSNGILKINTTDPNDLLLNNSCDLAEDARDVHIENNEHLFVADGINGILSFNITNASEIVQLDSFDTNGKAYEIEFDNNYLFVADGTNGLVVVNVDGNAQISTQSSLKVAGNSKDVFYQSNTLYMAAENEGLMVIDLSDVSSPELLGKYNSPGEANGIYIHTDGNGYLADGKEGIFSIDLTDTTDPQVLGHNNLSRNDFGNADGESNAIITTAGDLGYIADAESGIKILNLSNPADPVMIGDFETNGTAQDLFIVDDVLYVADGKKGMVSINISSPNNPFLMDVLDTNGFANDICISNDFAYLADGINGILKIDVNNASDLLLNTTYDTPGRALGLTIQNDEYLYVADGEGGLHSFNITNSEELLYLDTFDTNGITNDIYFKNNITYIADGTNGLAIFNVSDPTQIQIKGTLTLEGISKSVSMQNDVLFITAERYGLYSIDVDNITMPTILDEYNSPGTANDISFHEGFGFLADGKTGVLSIQIYDPTNLQVFGYHNLGRNYIRMKIEDDPFGKYLFEGFRVTYNTTSPMESFNITMKIVDEVSGNEWTKTKNIAGDGANNKIFKFINYNDYFITDNQYSLYIYNGTAKSDMLLKIPFSSFENLNDQNYFNISTTLDPYGTYLDYGLLIQPYFEYGNYLSPDLNGLENEDDPKTSRFDYENYVDIFYMDLYEGREYNFYLFDDNQSHNCYLQFYQEDVQKPILNTSLLSFSSMINGTGTLPNPQHISINETGRYFVMIQANQSAYTDFLKYGENCEMWYQFCYSAAPLPMTLNSPEDNQYLSELNNPINLDWERDSSDSDIFKYEIQIYNNSQMGIENLKRSVFVEGISNSYYIFNASKEGIYYWRVRGIDNTGESASSKFQNNNGTWSELGFFNFDTTQPEAPIIEALPKVIEETSINLNWEASDDGIFDVEKYDIYLANRPIFQKGVVTDEYEEYLVGTIRDRTTFTVSGLRNNYHYYISIEATDNVGKKSKFSAPVDTSISLGGYVSAIGQDLSTVVGDTRVYEVAYVESTNLNSFSEPLMTFFYHDFPQGTRFHFWVQNVDYNDAFPVLSKFYATDIHSDSDAWNLIDERTPITVFSLSPDISYQKNVTALYLNNEIPYEDFSNSDVYSTLWRSGNNVADVRVISYWTDNRNSTASFFINKETGDLLELTIYTGVLEDEDERYGYSLRLITEGSSVEFEDSNWENAYIYFIIGSIGLATIINKLIKKVEY